MAAIYIKVNKSNMNPSYDTRPGREYWPIELHITPPSLFIQRSIV